LDHFEELDFELPWNSFGKNATTSPVRELVLRLRDGFRG
jgi:hypothetical protein